VLFGTQDNPDDAHEKLLPGPLPPAVQRAFAGSTRTYCLSPKTASPKTCEPSPQPLLCTVLILPSCDDRKNRSRELGSSPISQAVRWPSAASLPRDTPALGRVSWLTGQYPPWCHACKTSLPSRCPLSRIKNKRTVSRNSVKKIRKIPFRSQLGLSRY
jgi:hypothetical protein